MSGREVTYRILQRYDLGALTDGVLASFAGRPEFQPLRPPQAELRSWVQWNIDLVIRWLMDGLPPTDKELDGFREIARIAAANGTPPDAIPANYRLGARFAWDWLMGAATEEERTVLVGSAGLLFDFVDRVSRVFSDAYEKAARTGPFSDDERAAQTLLTRLGQNAELSLEDRQFAEEIGFDLAGPYYPFVIVSRSRSLEQLIGVARRVRSQNAVAISSGRRVTVLAHVPLSRHLLDLDAGDVFAQGDLTLRGELGAALEELYALVEVALERERFGLIALDEYLPEVMLRRSPRIAHRLTMSVYGRLETENPELARTLDCFVENNFDRGRTAAALPVHRNTLANRLNRIRGLTGLDVDDSEGLMLAALVSLNRSRRINDRSGRLGVSSS